MAQKNLIKKFILNLFTPKKYLGELKGRDYNGTEYYESKQGNRRPPRWYKTDKEEDVDPQIPPVWEAWLRHTRKEPPTEQEVELYRLKMLEVNAEKLKKVKENKETKKTSFPEYEEYKTNP